ncbi:UNVERIFIED_CONTAM: Viridiflorene synthase [Sesamum radiatum]|uniref:Viridiflorene synthase n=1 Tax=Sesamum radiatum TaxID=300843 RepID=A0AAW2TXD9_SESRA
MGDLFTSVPIDNQVVEFYAQEIESLKEKVRRMIVSNNNNVAEKLKLIDSIERLGVSYHFEREIEAQILNLYNARSIFESDDLYTVALYFRLLRQHGHHISSGIFHKFTESDGKFKNSLRDKGLLSLYEAANLRTRGEGVLDEALTFATAHLESIAPHLSSLEGTSSACVGAAPATRHPKGGGPSMLHRKELCELSRLRRKEHKVQWGYIECYMKDYGVSEEEAMEEFKKIAENAWKDINEECVKEKSVSMEVLKRVVNLSRLMIDVVYKHNQDGYTHPEKVLKPLITGLLVDSFSIQNS